MMRNYPQQEVPLEEFITRPDTIPLIEREGFLADQEFRETHGVRVGTQLAANFRIDYVDRSQIDNIKAEAGENILSMLPIVLGLLGQQDIEKAGILQVQNQPYLDLKGQNTLIGFIDTGIDYTQNAFRYEDGSSKIQYIWDQTLSGTAPGEFYFGAEYSAADINQALQSDTPQYIVPHQDTVGHGTFLASVAAGRATGDNIGAAPDAEIIAVKLRKAKPFFYEEFLVPEWQENAYMSSDLLLGIQYIISKAEELDRPVSICIAVGSNLGGHDGSSLMEEYLTRLSNATGVAVVCAAGNESQRGHHASGKLAETGETKRVEFVMGENEEDILLTVWNSASDRLAVSFTSPTGEFVPRYPVRTGASYGASLVLEKARITIEYYLPIRGSGDQLTVIRIFNPTPGVWNLNIYGEIVLDGAYDVWMPMTGFVDPEAAFLTPDPNDTVVTPATAIRVISCGAYSAATNSLYLNSSWGYTRLPEISPVLSAPGVDAGGIFPTGFGQMSGTSVSAAITAGACALLLQWGIVNGNDSALTSIRIKAILIRGCERDSSIQYPNPQWGYGKLNLYNSFNVLRPL